MSVVHAYSCREENCWAYVSVCGLSWLNVHEAFERATQVVARSRIGEQPIVTCRLCRRRIVVHQVRARIAADVLRDYDVGPRVHAPARLRVVA